MNSASGQRNRATLKGVLLSLTAVAVFGSALVPALADDRDRDHRRPVRVERRDHRYYGPPPGVYVAPPVAYAPPPVVYQPAPSLNVVIPLRF